MQLMPKNNRLSAAAAEAAAGEAATAADGRESAASAGADAGEFGCRVGICGIGQGAVHIDDGGQI